MINFSLNWWCLDIAYDWLNLSVLKCFRQQQQYGIIIFLRLFLQPLTEGLNFYTRFHSLTFRLHHHHHYNQFHSLTPISLEIKFVFVLSTLKSFSTKRVWEIKWNWGWNASVKIEGKISAFIESDNCDKFERRMTKTRVFWWELKIILKKNVIWSMLLRGAFCFLKSKDGKLNFFRFFKKKKFKLEQLEN